MSSFASHFRREFLLRWSLALAATALILYFFSPSWGAFQLASRVPELQGMIEVRRGMSVLQQVEHPGAPIADPLHAAIQWRLLFPAIGHVLHLSPGLFFALAPLGCILLLGALVSLFRRAGVSWSRCAAAVVIIGAASWFFTATGWLGYFDSWFALGLVLFAFSDSKWVRWAACVWTPWVDERFVLAFPLALLCRFLWQTRSPRSTTVRAFDWRREATIPTALVAAFAAVRLGILPSHSAGGATVNGYLADKNFLAAPLSRIALGVWEGLRAGWCFVALAFVALAANPKRAVLLVAATLMIVLIGLATAQDYSRSMTMILPVAVLGALLSLSPTANDAQPWPRAARVLGPAVVVGLLLPAHHVMNDRVSPIYYLYHELAALENPPPTAMPELYELRAIHEMERGEFAQADADLALAIKLSRNPASPSKQRGILAASQRRWADAHRDFSVMVEHDSKNPDAWFMRAQANLALGNATAAQADFQQATSIAPSDWTTRPDVARFAASLTRAAGSR